jgi:hypothetical protein
MEETSREVERDFGTGPLLVLVVGGETDSGAAAVIKASEE